MEEDLIVVSATRLIVPRGYSSYFGDHTYDVVDIYQDGKVFVRQETYKRQGVSRERVGQGVSVKIYQTVAEFRAAHPVTAKQIMEYLRESNLHLPWIEDRSPDLKQQTSKCKICGEIKHIKEFPAKDMSFSGIHSDCCACRKVSCIKEGFWCIAPATEKCRECPIQEKKK
jgi:hypothetical protein